MSIVMSTVKAGMLALKTCPQKRRKNDGCQEGLTNERRGGEERRAIMSQK